MSANPTNEPREQARLMVSNAIKRRVVDGSVINKPWELIDQIEAALSSRDAEVREVLEGIRGFYGTNDCWCDSEGDAPHFGHCDAARALYAKLQPRKEEDDVAVETD